MPIAFVSATSAFSNIGSLASFNVSKPAGVATGDLMVAVIAFKSSGGQRTVTLGGWTHISTAFYDTGSANVQVGTYYRFVEAGDPATWNGTLSGNGVLITTGSAAWSGVQAVGLSGSSTTGLGTSLATATVNNPAATNWRVTVGAYNSGSTSYTIASNETTRRVLFAADDSGSTGATQAAIWDSNATIATGNTNRTVSRSANWSVAGSVILLLTAVTGTPATGTVGMTLSPISMAASGSVHNDAVVSTTLSPITMAFDGFGQPPNVDGVIGVTLNPVQVSAAGATDVAGSMSMLLLPAIQITAETRVFGIRVIAVERDTSRIVRVPSRAVDD